MDIQNESTPLLTKKDNLRDKSSSPSLLISVRFLLTFLLFLGAAIQCMQKIDMSISIVCMVNSSSANLPLDNSSSSDNDACLFKLNETESNNKGEFNWSKRSQGIVLSSYFYGYLLTQIPGGWLSLKFGGKRILGLSMMIGSILTVLVPIASRQDFLLLLLCRFVTGLAHGMVWPAANDIFIRWIPVAEKSRLIGFASAGTKIGNIFALPLGTYLCVNGFDNGWPSIFYIYGLIGIVWLVLFMLLTSNSPASHKFISRTESDYLFETTYAKQREIRNSSDRKKIRKKKTPWFRILTSRPCIAIYFAQFSSNWGNYLFLTQLPTFMNEILKFDIQSNGMFSALPYLTGWVCAIVSSQISDILIDAQVLSRKAVRKVFSSFALFVPMAATLALAFVDCSNPYLAVILLALGVGFLGLSTGAGFVININEVGGVYSGVLFGISNTFGTIPGIVAPYIVGVLTPNKLQIEWRVVFILTSVIYFIGGAMFAWLSEAEPQPWAINRYEEKEENEE